MEPACIKMLDDVVKLKNRALSAKSAYKIGNVDLVIG